MDCTSYDILQQTTPADGAVVVSVSVVDSKRQHGGEFEFKLVQHEYGKKQGSWMTKSLLKKHT